MLLRKQKTWKMDFLSSGQVTAEGPGKARHTKRQKYGDNKERRVVSSMEIKIFGVTPPNQCAMENEQNPFLSLPFQSEKHMM